ncbi:MAG TPA: tetratricopeptide repeat protein [Ktedonobacterales bacterium]
MDRTTLTERLRRAEAEIAANRPEQALAYCQELQTAYPRALRVQRVLGEIYLTLRRPREALAALDRALMGDPEDVRACCARALVHQMHGDNVAALAWYRRACDLRPQDQTLRATYRDLARRLGEPPYRPSRAGLARLYLRGDLFAHAIREWEQLVTESPDMLDAQVGLAETLWLAGHTRAAEERCLRILSNAPSCVKAMLIQMALALADGDMDTARAHLERTLQLDPDMAIAQVVFADALASGDPVMTALLRPIPSNEQPTEAVTGRPAGYAQSGARSGQRNLSRPLVTSAPTTGGPAHNAPPPTGPLSSPLRPDVPVPSQPTEVTRAFKETAFMIWGQDDDNQSPTAAPQPGVAGDAGWGNAPPVLRDLRGVLNDEETKRALNWYNWLQAQGAVTLGAAAASPPPPPPAPPPAAVDRPQSISAPWSEADPARAPGDISAALPSPPLAPPSAPASESHTPAVPGGSPKLTMPIPPQSPVRQTMPLKPAELEQIADETLGDGEPETVPLPLPPADALRTMFAELGGNSGVASGETAENMPETPAGHAASAGMGAGQHVEADASSDDLSASLWPAAANVANSPDVYGHDDTHDAHEAYEAYGDDIAADSAKSAESDESDAQSPEQPWDAEHAPNVEHGDHSAPTLEDLERQFSASGFTLIETHHGLLAEIERAEQSGFTAASQEQPSVTPVTPVIPGAPATPGEPEVPEQDAGEPAPTETIPSGPNPKDYPARLAHARQRRTEGQLDDALNEYRAIIKNAPDLLPEVLSDLNASLEELPDHPNLHSVLGDALVSQGQYEQALEAYNRATALAQARSDQS